MNSYPRLLRMKCVCAANAVHCRRSPLPLVSNWRQAPAHFRRLISKSHPKRAGQSEGKPPEKQIDIAEGLKLVRIDDKTLVLGNLIV
jgi:hypothetical protein